MRLRPQALAAPLAAVVLAAAGCGGKDGAQDTGVSDSPDDQVQAAPAQPGVPAALKQKPKVRVPQGAAPKQLQRKDLVEGKGKAAKSSDQLSVQYVGVLYKNGKEFDSSFKQGKPFEFQLGAGMVIPGWDKGLQGMKVGGRRQLVIPASDAYGAQGSPPAIGPDEPLVFVIDLLAAN